METAELSSALAPPARPIAQVQPREAHVISHTHWDREWYKPYQGFRYHLVRVIDDILDRLDADPDYRYFHLDGQTIVLEDYVEIRPERRDLLQRRIREGRILIGPFYNMPDLFLVNGESLVRNLQLGHLLCREWDAPPLPVGYAVDIFGHCSQMPQIYAGFGLKATTLFRGIIAQVAGSEFIWVGPDGTECLVLRLDDHKAYSNFWYTFRSTLTHRADYDEEVIRKGIEELVNELTEHAATPYLLFMDGVDHATANPRTTRIIADANKNFPQIKFYHSSWPEYLEKITDYLRDNNIPLKRIHGELRWPNQNGRLNRLLPDVGSSRIYLKIKNKESETALLNWLEPLHAIAGWLGIPHPAGFLMLAWKYLLKNHPHDSICGCSVDQVHRDMEYRFDQVLLIAREAGAHLLEQISSKVNTSCVAGDEEGIFVYNASQYERAGVVRLRLETRRPNPPASFALLDAEGRQIPYQLLERRALNNRIFYTPITCAEHAMGATEFELAAEIDRIPAMGYRVLRMKGDQHPADTGKALIAEASGVMENGHLRVEFDERGQVNLLHKATGWRFLGLHNFEDCGEVGDLWNHVSPAVDRVIHGVKSARVLLVANGPLLATTRVEYTLELPAGASADMTARADEMAEQKIVSDFTLTRSSQALKVETVITNTIRNHRLRVTFPSDIRADVNHASSQFDVVARKIKLMENYDWKDRESEIKPTQGFIDVHDGASGLAVTTFGLPEYAVLDDERRTIALTLLRTLSNTVGTEGEDGPECMREIRFIYAIYPHAGSWEQAEVFRILDEQNLEPRAISVTAHTGELPDCHGFIRIEPANLIYSSLRSPYGEDKAAVLRIYNPTTETITGRIGLPRSIVQAALCNLNDEPLNSLKIVDCDITITVGPKKIASIRFE